MIAWTDIHAHVDGQGKVKTIKRGSEVTQDDLGVDNDEWQLLIDGGSVRDQKFPKDLRPGETVSNYRFRKANEAMALAEAEGRGDTEAADILNSGNTSAGNRMAGGNPLADISGNKQPPEGNGQ